uniref:Uncharacterized protein n=1 Tax=Onchocerca volvulus TaxID=6282 RepID=A0A8R1TXM7_ONCVO
MECFLFELARMVDCTEVYDISYEKCMHRAARIARKANIAPFYAKKSSFLASFISTLQEEDITYESKKVKRSGIQI